MRRATAPISSGSDRAGEGNAPRGVAPARLGSARRRNQGPVANGTGLVAPQRGADGCAIRLPSTPFLSLPTFAEEVPGLFTTSAKVKVNGRLALPNLLTALHRERVVQARHWEPGKDLLKVATDGLQDWAHCRGRLGVYPLKELGFLELHVTGDIDAFEDLYQGVDVYRNGWSEFQSPDHGIPCRPLAALGLNLPHEFHNGCTLKPWAEVIERVHGEDVAKSLIGVINRALPVLSGWGPEYAYGRMLDWGLENEDDGVTIEEFQREIPPMAISTDFKHKHLHALSKAPGMEGSLGEAANELAYALRKPRALTDGKPRDRHGASFWGTNHAHGFGAWPHPAVVVLWSDKEIEGAGFDAVQRILDDEFEGVNNTECTSYPWLYAFDPLQEGGGPGSLRFALAALGRALRVARALDRMLALLDVSEQRVRISL
jgi:hypothetical protein